MLQILGKNHRTVKLISDNISYLFFNITNKDRERLCIDNEDKQDTKLNLSIIGTPSSLALRSLEPASSPISRYEVFFETDDTTLPPFFSMSADASSLDIPGSVPVMQIERPARLVPMFSSARSILRPASLRRPISAMLSESWKKP